MKNAKITSSRIAIRDYISGLSLKISLTALIVATLGIAQGMALNDEGNERKSDNVQMYNFGYGDHLPAFPGGDNRLAEYIGANLTYPERPREIGVSGTVFVGFKVNEDGSISDIKVEKGVFSDLDEEALRVIKEMPKWDAAVRANQPIGMEVVLPVQFRLQ